jgi:YD repeat-containing protein
MFAPRPSFAADPIFDAKGAPPNREMLSQLSFEHVDPMTGNLLLTFTDLVLPGNAGFDLKIQRTYNSKIYEINTSNGGFTLGEDSWAGLGWTLMLGRVTDDGTPTAMPVIEMADGSRHATYHHRDGNPNHFMTKDFWTFERGGCGAGTPPRLHLPNGVVYTFDHCAGALGHNYVTDIRDLFGNRIAVNYDFDPAPPPGEDRPEDAIFQIKQYISSQKVRTVTFAYNHDLPDSNGNPKDANSLSTMTLTEGSSLGQADGRTWTYHQELLDNYGYVYTKLTSVQPPQPPGGAPSWFFTYTTATSATPHILQQVNLPAGGTINYTFVQQLFWLPTGGSSYSPAVTARVTGDGNNSNFVSGTWTYQYDCQTASCQPPANGQLTTTVTAPGCDINGGGAGTTIYRFKGLYSSSNQPEPWSTGSQTSRTVRIGGPSGTILESQAFTWQRSDPISKDPEQPGFPPNTYVALPLSTIVQRGSLGTQFTTLNTYNLCSIDSGSGLCSGDHDGDPAHHYYDMRFSDFGRAFKTTETGNLVDAGNSLLSRTTERTFFYTQSTDPSFATFIADSRLLSETISVGAGSFRRSWAYNTTTGFKESEEGWHAPGANDGVLLSYAVEPGTGNVKSVEDLDNDFTYYTYDWGMPQSKSEGTTQSSAPSKIQRQINADGTIGSETRWNSQSSLFTAFGYDSLFRPTSVQPPQSNPRIIAYDSNGRGVTVTRGSSVHRTNLDGFGREQSTETGGSATAHIWTHTRYDACGNVRYSSYPYAPTGEVGTGQIDIGTTTETDPIGRVTKTWTPSDGNNPGSANSSTQYSYSNLAVTITEKLDLTTGATRQTTQDWRAFGDVDDTRLAHLTDANGKTTGYFYNALGSITEVDPAIGGKRVWQYNSLNQLVFETQPESGVVGYTYAPDGMLATRTEHPGSGQVVITYVYDDENRLTNILRPAAPPPNPTIDRNTEIQYDRSDNRTSLRYGGITSSFEPDTANRLHIRTDHIGAVILQTQYGYDDNDNLMTLTYPSGQVVGYKYDDQDRVSEVNNGSPCGGMANPCFANQFGYHSSGGVFKYTSGNGVAQTIQYDSNRYWVKDVKAALGSVDKVHLALNAYDNVGNVTSITDSVQSPTAQVLGYDKLDRLVTANGFWGSGSFSYDEIGNRNTKTLLHQTTTYHYDVGSTGTDRLLSTTQAPTASNESFAYDANGSWLGSSALNALYSYGSTHMMETAKAGSSLSGIEAPTFGSYYFFYDGDGLRKRKTAGSGSQLYVHGPGNQVLSEFAWDGINPARAAREYVYAGSRLIAAVEPPSLSVTPAELAFATVLGTNPPASSLSMSAGGANLPWQSVSDSWIKLLPVDHGTLPSSVNVQIQDTNMDIGVYPGNIEISATGALGSPVDVPVLLAITRVPGLVTLPTSLQFVMNSLDGNPLPKTLHILMSGGAPVSWHATSTPPWLKVDFNNTTGGTTASTVSVSVDGTGMAPNTYEGFIEVTSDVPGTPGSPRFVPVELVILPSPGADCEPGYFYCETFDHLSQGDLDGQGGWVANTEDTGQVVPDDRGLGNVVRLDPPVEGFINDEVDFPDHTTDSIQISVQVMAQDVPVANKQISKLEFYTVPGVAWGKTTRTFGALRFGSRLYLQYGPNVYQVLMDQLESNRWYDVKVVYQGQTLRAYIDGALVFETVNPIEPGHPVQAFVTSAWDFPGKAYLDRIDGRDIPNELVVDPPELHFTKPSTTATVKVSDGATASGNSPARPQSSAAKGHRLVKQQLQTMPLGFEVNEGQAETGVLFQARGDGYLLSLTDSGAALWLAPVSSQVRMHFEGGKQRAEIAGEELLPGVVNYATDRLHRSGIQSYGRVRYKNVYPGVDAVFHGNQRSLEYDLVVEPGADPSVVRVAFEGLGRARITPEGEVAFEAGDGEIRQLKPVAYQDVAGERRDVESHYALTADGSVGVTVGDYDHALPLVVDPTIAYLTALPLLDSTGYAVAVDDDGMAYFAGSTTTFSGAPPDAFVAKIDPTGGTLVYTTIIGDTGSEVASAIAIDGLGRAYVAGTANNTAFVARLTPSGVVEYLTSLGGGSARGIAVDSAYRAFVVGGTDGGIVTTSGALQPAPLGCPTGNPVPNACDGFVARLGAAGGVEYATYLGGTGNDAATSIALNGSGLAYVAGGTASPDFPLTPGAWDTTLLGPSDAFVTNLDTSKVGSQGLVASTLLGGSDVDTATGIAVDPLSGRAFVVGTTHSVDLPTTEGAPQVSAPGGADAFVGVLFPDLAARQFLTYWGSTDDDSGLGIALGANATTISITGSTKGTGFPHYDQGACESDPFVTFDSCSDDPFTPFVAQFSDDGFGNYGPFYSACVRPEDEGWTGNGVAVDLFGDTYLTGYAAGGVHYGAYVLKLGCAAPVVGSELRFTSEAMSWVEDQNAIGGYSYAMAAVERGAPLDTTVTVSYSTADGTATAPDDYQTTTGTLTFYPHEVTLPILVPIKADTIAESNETLTLSLFNPTNGILGTPSQETITIEDDDGLVRTLTIRDSVLTTGPAWSAQKDAAWLTLSAYSGTGPSTITATADPTGLPAGTYTATIVVTATGTGGSPKVVPVTLKVPSTTQRGSSR